jgi:hypothetical protein
MPQRSSQPSNRVKTLHSLLYLDHKSIDIDQITTNPNRRSDSVLSECYSSKELGQLQTEHSSLTNLNHDFIIKSKFNQIEQEPRQINSWDDI